MQTVEKDDIGVRNRKVNLISRGKTLLIVFPFENEWFAKIGFLIGNDLETSKVLYSVLYCTNQKNTFTTAKVRFLFYKSY